MGMSRGQLQLIFWLHFKQTYEKLVFNLVFVNESMTNLGKSFYKVTWLISGIFGFFKPKIQTVSEQTIQKIIMAEILFIGEVQATRFKLEADVALDFEKKT